MDEKVKVYNFEVEGNHNYYVSQLAKSPDFEPITKVIPIQYAPKSGDFGEQNSFPKYSKVG